MVPGLVGTVEVATVPVLSDEDPMLPGPAMQRQPEADRTPPVPEDQVSCRCATTSSGTSNSLQGFLGLEQSRRGVVHFFSGAIAFGSTGERSLVSSRRCRSASSVFASASRSAARPLTRAHAPPRAPSPLVAVLPVALIPPALSSTLESVLASLAGGSPSHESADRGFRPRGNRRVGRRAATRTRRARRGPP